MATVKVTNPTPPLTSPNETYSVSSHFKWLDESNHSPLTKVAEYLNFVSRRINALATAGFSAANAGHISDKLRIDSCTIEEEYFSLLVREQVCLNVAGLDLAASTATLARHRLSQHNKSTTNKNKSLTLEALLPIKASSCHKARICYPPNENTKTLSKAVDAISRALNCVERPLNSVEYGFRKDLTFPGEVFRLPPSTYEIVKRSLGGSTIADTQTLLSTSQAQTSLLRFRDGRRIVVKSCNSSLIGVNHDLDSRIIEDIALLRMLDSKHTVSPLAISSEFAYFEYFPFGDLFDIMTLHPVIITESFVRRVVTNLFFAVRDLHDRGLVHGDLKPDQLLIQNASGDCVLADLGFSTKPQKLVSGTVIYSAPEVLFFSQPTTLASDMFSLGMTLATFILNNHPSYYFLPQMPTMCIKNPHILLNAFQNAIHCPQTQPLLEARDPRGVLFDIARECLEYDPNDRPNIHKVIEIFNTAYNIPSQNTE